MKIIIFAFLVSLTLSFQYYPSWKNAEQLRPITLGSTKTTQKIIKGGSITTQIQSVFKSIIETAYVYYADSMNDSAQYMQRQLNTRYEGNWLITIYNGNSTNKTTASIGDNLENTFYSMNNSWWIYWQGANHYKPEYAYFLTRMPKNGTTYICKSNIEVDSSTTTFKNIVNAVELDVKTVTQNANQISKYLALQLPTKFPNVQISNNVAYYSCIWGNLLSYDLIRQSSVLKFNDLAFYWPQ